MWHRDPTADFGALASCAAMIESLRKPLKSWIVFRLDRDAIWYYDMDILIPTDDSQTLKIYAKAFAMFDKAVDITKDKKL